jgi:hypothetical protein
MILTVAVAPHEDSSLTKACLCWMGVGTPSERDPNADSSPQDDFSAVRTLEDNLRFWWSRSYYVTSPQQT